MRRYTAIRLTGFLFLIGLCFLFLSPVSFRPASAGSGVSEGRLIRLAQATFDPLEAVPAVPADLAYNAQEAQASGSYILQFSGPVLDAWKAAIAADGAILGPYIPDDAFIVRLAPASLAVVKALPYVRWVGPYHPAYKLAKGIDASSPRSYRVVLAPWSQPASAASKLAALGAVMRTTPAAAPNDTAAVVGDSLGAALVADLSGPAIAQAARLDEVLWIEPIYLQKAYNNVAGGTIMNGSTAWANGYTGAGVTVAVTDTGLDTGNPSVIHQDFAGRVTHIESEPVLAANYGGCYVITNPGADDGAADVSSGHGTHVTGSAAGSGAASGGTFKGLAYQANIVFQAVEQWTTWNGTPCTNGYILSGIPDDIRTLLTTEYNWGARIQNDSWGGGTAGVYDSQASYFDDFVHTHPNFTIVVAAGNSGVDLNPADGYVDTGSVNSPATAKNLIVVGASQSERASGSDGYAGYTWADLWYKRYSAAPTGTDIIGSSRGKMAAFSSRGPTLDGRIKPDVVAPGTDIISVRSSLATETGWGVYNSNYMYMGGTSMASPLTTGAAALVRQYYMVHEGVLDPSAALIKATLINTAVDIPGYGNSSYEAGQPIPNTSEGWGRVDVGAATTPGRKFVEKTPGLTTNGTDTYTYNIASGKPFKVTLVWSDYMGTANAAQELVNNLNLKVTAPDGATTYWGNQFSGGWSIAGGYADTVNNVENVYIHNPTSGIWKVEVIGQNVPMGPQPYALVLDGNFNLPAAFNKTAPANGVINQPANPTLTWGSSAGAVSYAYCIDTSSNAACDTSWVSAGANTSASLSGLAANTTYSWQVRATNPNGDTYADNGAWFTFAGQITPPGAFQKTAPANGAINQPANTQLTWGASANAASYAYCIDTSNNSACNTSWISTGSSTSVQPVGLVNALTYYWQVRAINLAGPVEADGGTWFSFTAKVDPPGAFQKAGPANGATGLPPALTLSWGSSAGAEGYQVCYDTTNNNICNASWIPATGTSLGTIGLNYNTSYYWQVRAVNTTATVDSNGGAWWVFTTGVLPGAFNKQSPGSGAIGLPLDQVLSWGSSSGAASYEVCVDKFNNGVCDTSWIPAAGTSLAPGGLTPAVNYYWQVRAVNSAGSIEAANGWWHFTTLLFRFFMALIRH